MPDPAAIYPQYAPPGHSRICWAAAIGTAGRGRWAPHDEARARLAAEMLADGRTPCICHGREQPRGGRTGRRPRRR